MVIAQLIYRQFLPLLVSLVILQLFHYLGIHGSLSNISSNLLFHIRGTVQPSHPIIIIGVDEESQTHLGSWPFPRARHADLLDKLSMARVVAFDFLFISDTSDDKKLSNTIQKSPPVVLAAAHDSNGNLLTPSPALLKYASIGHIETLRSSDGIVRNVQLFSENNPASFASVMARKAGFSNLPGNDYEVIHYLGPERTFPTVSYHDVLEGKYSEDFFLNAFVLVGALDRSLGDFHATPFTLRSLTSGVEIQANILHNLLTDSFLKRKGNITLAMLLFVALLGLLVWPRCSESVNCAVNISILFLLSAITIYLFYKGILVESTTVIIFLFLFYLLHLLGQIILLARQLLRLLNLSEEKIASNMTNLFHSPPRYLGLQKETSAMRFFPEVQHRYRMIQKSGEVLDLQNEFIQHVLSEESPPLILWEKESGDVILKNRGFVGFWTDCQPANKENAIPDLHTFINLLQKTENSGIGPSIDLLRTDTFNFNMDLLLPDSRNLKKYYRISLRSVSLAKGQFNGILAGITDVTEIKEMERIKDEVVSIVSHELKLPLTTIRGYGEMLEDLLEDKPMEYARSITEQAGRLNQFINDFLHINRLESGKEEVNFFPYDLLNVLSESIEAVSYPASEKQISTVLHGPAKVSSLLGDELLLVQAFINILENSIKYSPGNTEVSVDLQEMTAIFVITFKDQGPGIPPSETDNVFEKFNRGKNHGKSESFGLGLSFTRQVIHRHNGQIEHDGSQNGGTTIIITLPKKI